MNLAAKIVGLVVIALAPAFADNLLVVGGPTTGTFSNQTAGTLHLGDSSWTYAGSGDFSSTLTFLSGDLGFLGVTPVGPFVIGILTDDNNDARGKHDTADTTVTANLDVNVPFLFPTLDTVSFDGSGLTVSVEENFNAAHDDQVQGLNNFEGQTAGFTYNGQQYLVTLEGFYSHFLNQNGGPISSFDTADGSNSAYLWADITAVPEPSSAILLITICGMAGLTLRQRRKA